MKKRKPGRPRNKPGEGREILLQVRVTAAEKAAFAEAAKRSGESLSVWARKALRWAVQEGL